MDARRPVKWLLAAVLALPLVQGLLTWVAGLLSAMGDEAAAGVLGRIGVALGVLWIVALAGLLIAVAFRTLDEQNPPRE